MFFVFQWLLFGCSQCPLYGAMENNKVIHSLSTNHNIDLLVKLDILDTRSNYQLYLPKEFLMTVALALNEASTLFDILLENAELTNDERFVRQFSDIDRSRVEYAFTGEYSDFTLIARNHNDGQPYWELAKHEADVLKEEPTSISVRGVNERLLNVYARGK